MPWLSPARADALARLLAVIVQGLSVQARDGASAADLQAIVETAMEALPPR